MLSLSGLWEAFKITQTPSVKNRDPTYFNSFNLLIFIPDFPQRESASTYSCLLGGILGQTPRAGWQVRLVAVLPKGSMPCWKCWECFDLKFCFL